MRFVLPGADDDLGVVADTAGPLALTLREPSDAERAAARAGVEAPLSRFPTGRGDELLEVSLCVCAGAGPSSGRRGRDRTGPIDRADGADV